MQEGERGEMQSKKLCTIGQIRLLSTVSQVPSLVSTIILGLHKIVIT